MAAVVRMLVLATAAAFLATGLASTPGRPLAILAAEPAPSAAPSTSIAPRLRQTLPGRAAGHFVFATEDGERRSSAALAAGTAFSMQSVRAPGMAFSSAAILCVLACFVRRRGGPARAITSASLQRRIPRCVGPQTCSSQTGRRSRDARAVGRLRAGELSGRGRRAWCGRRIEALSRAGRPVTGLSRLPARGAVERQQPEIRKVLARPL